MFCRVFSILEYDVREGNEWSWECEAVGADGI